MKYVAISHIEWRMNSMRKAFFVSGLLVAIMLAFLAGLTVNMRRPQPVDDQAFNEVFNHIMNYHYTNPEEETLWRGAIDGMIRALGDDFSHYYDAAEARQYEEAQGESFVGIGVTVQNVDEQVVINSIFPESPAERAGLMVGDIIRFVDGVDYLNRSYIETVFSVRGEEGSTVEIGIERPGVPDIINLIIVRERIENPSVTYRVIGSGGYQFGYIKINMFGNETADNFKAAIDDLESQNIQGLIVDVRDNGGGDLFSVVNIMNYLLPIRNNLFSIEFFAQGTSQTQYYHSADDHEKDYPVTVLINQHSASAAEVFASVMYEVAEYPLIGQTTFGKGTVQTRIPMTNVPGDYLHITRGVWRTTNGNWVHFDGGTNGYEPQIKVEQNPAFLIPPLFIRAGESFAFNDVHPQIENAQKMLNALGYTVRTDGYFDSNMQDILEQFQLLNNLESTATLNPETAQFLNESMLAYRQDASNDLQLSEALDYLISQND